MKYKRLTKEQIIISLDRLTRFKPTKEKYLRVFFDIITGNLTEPRYKRTQLESMDCEEIKNYAQEIFNASVEPSETDYVINKKIKEYENSVYINDTTSQILLDNKINYTSALKYIDVNAPVNLKWLKSLAENNDPTLMREEHFLKYPIEKVLLVEGLTEEILLPAFSKFLGYDFYQKGIQIIPAGGKNQVVKMYYKLTQEIKIPIFVVLDKDAEDNIAQIKPRLRDSDKIHLVSSGEFEDLLPNSLIIKTVNSHFKNFLTITEDDLAVEMPNAKILENLFKTKGLHEFKKADFAKLVRENIQEPTDISPEISQIVAEISGTNKTVDSKLCS